MEYISPDEEDEEEDGEDFNEDEALEESEDDEAPSLPDHEPEDEEDKFVQSEGDDDDFGAGDIEDEEWSGFGGDLSPDQQENATAESAQTHASSDKPIPGTRYVPPHMRNRQADSGKEQQSEEQAKLTRQLKGLLNRYLNSIHHMRYFTE